MPVGCLSGGRIAAEPLERGVSHGLFEALVEQLSKNNDKHVEEIFFNKGNRFYLSVAVLFTCLASSSNIYAAGGVFNKDQSGTLTIQPTVNNAPFGLPSFMGPYAAGTDRPFSLPPQATDVTFSISAGGAVIQTETDWAQAAQTGGGFQLLNLDSAIATRIGSGEFVIPQLFSSTVPLFTLVDLNQWTNQAFTVGETVNVTNGQVFGAGGVHLTGLLVGTSPILFSSATGESTASPFTGTATVDGRNTLATPEPSALLLLGSGLAGIVAWKRKCLRSPSV